ncbi:MAG: thioredoxin family protein [Acidobacteriota bacterium]
MTEKRKQNLQELIAKEVDLLYRLEKGYRVETDVIRKAKLEADIEERKKLIEQYNSELQKLIVGLEQSRKPIQQSNGDSNNSSILALTDKNFVSEILFSKIPVLIYFYSSSNTLSIMTAILGEIAQEYAGKLIVGKTDLNKNIAISIKFNILATPTTLLITNGIEQQRIIGLVSRAKLTTIVSKI